MGRHSVARKRRRSPLGLAAVIAPVAVFFAAGGDVSPLAFAGDPHPVVSEAAPCCVELVAAEPIAPVSAAVSGLVATNSAPDYVVAASRRVAAIPRVLPPGVCDENRLQVKTILVARAVSAFFPEIHSMSGYRPDALRWHPNGLAVDVMIPNPGSAEGIALGNQIVAFALKNAGRFALQDAIWRGVYYTPGGGAQSGGYGHFDHVHLTTFGGGYPTGSEIYVR
jgi:hypothetical protein